MVVRLLIVTLMFFAPHLHGVAFAEEPVILTVEGKTASGDPVDFTLSQLEALGVAQEITSSPWYDGAVTFEGVRLSRVLEATGASGQTLRAIALNNYFAEIPISDASEFDVLVAFKINGSILQVRDKGPLFIIYPFDRIPSTKNELYFSKSVWQLRRIRIE